MEVHLTKPQHLQKQAAKWLRQRVEAGRLSGFDGGVVCDPATPSVSVEATNLKGHLMRKILTILPLVAMIAACSDNDSLESQGQKAGAAADNAIERVENRADAERKEFESGAANVAEKARGVEQDVKDGLSKADNAVDAAVAELKK
jgi:hypothetical protein